MASVPQAPSHIPQFLDTFFPGITRKPTVLHEKDNFGGDIFVAEHTLSGALGWFSERGNTPLEILLEARFPGILDAAEFPSDVITFDGGGVYPFACSRHQHNRSKVFTWVPEDEALKPQKFLEKAEETDSLQCHRRLLALVYAPDFAPDLTTSLMTFYAIVRWFMVPTARFKLLNPVNAQVLQGTVEKACAGLPVDGVDRAIIVSKGAFVSACCGHDTSLPKAVHDFPRKVFDGVSKDYMTLGSNITRPVAEQVLTLLTNNSNGSAFVTAGNALISDTGAGQVGLAVGNHRLLYVPKESHGKSSLQRVLGAVQHTLVNLYRRLLRCSGLNVEEVITWAEKHGLFGASDATKLRGAHEGRPLLLSKADFQGNTKVATMAIEVRRILPFFSTVEEHMQQVSDMIRSHVHRKAGCDFDLEDVYAVLCPQAEAPDDRVTKGVCAVTLAHHPANTELRRACSFQGPLAAEERVAFGCCTHSATCAAYAVRFFAKRTVGGTTRSSLITLPSLFPILSQQVQEFLLQVPAPLTQYGVLWRPGVQELADTVPSKARKRPAALARGRSP